MERRRPLFCSVSVEVEMKGSLQSSAHFAGLKGLSNQ